MIGEENNLPLSIVNPAIKVKLFNIYHVQAETSSEYHNVLVAA